MAMALDADFAVDLMLLGGLIGLAYYISKMKPESVEGPDYVSKFDGLAADAIMDVIEKRRATVEDAIVEGFQRTNQDLSEWFKRKRQAEDEE